MGGQCVLYDLYEGVAVVVWCLVHVRMSDHRAQALYCGERCVHMWVGSASSQALGQDALTASPSHKARVHKVRLTQSCAVRAIFGIGHRVQGVIDIVL